MKKSILICALLVSSLLLAQDSLKVKRYNLYNLEYEYIDTKPDKRSLLKRLNSLRPRSMRLQTEYEDGTIKECIIIREEDTLKYNLFG